MWYTSTWFVLLVIAGLGVLSFVMCAPTFLADRFFERFELHPTFRIEDELSVFVNDKEIPSEEKAEFIQQFNKVIFLYRYYDSPTFAGQPTTLCVKKGSKNYLFSVYSDENKYIYFVRHNGKKSIPYKAQSREFIEWLSTTCQRSAVR